MPQTWRSRLPLIAAVLVAAALVAVVVFVMLRPGDPATGPSETPTAIATATAEPSEAALPQPKPFEVNLRKTLASSVEVSNIFGRKPAAGRDVTKTAGDAAAAALQRYLNAMFVTPKSRFSSAAARDLVTQDAWRLIGSTERRALGVGLQDYKGARTRKVNARAVVLFNKTHPHGVTVTYRARLVMLSRDAKPQPVVQQGSIAFVRTSQGWRAQLVDVHLSGPAGGKS